MKGRIVQRNEPIGDSELIYTADKKMYHIHMSEEDIADDVILVGDQARVDVIAQHFDETLASGHNREFKWKKGRIGHTELTILSTGIGTDNIDIVVNELDAAVNIDPDTRTPKSTLRSLNLIRLGTSGSLQPDIPVDTLLISKFGLGFDGVMHFYDQEPSAEESEIQKEILSHLDWKLSAAQPYLVRGSDTLFERIGKGFHSGITATANGFYGPQGRSVRLGLKTPNLNDRLTSFIYKDLRITNYEMETSSLFGLASCLGHESTTVCAIIANRFHRSYSADYKATVAQMVETILERLTTA